MRLKAPSRQKTVSVEARIKREKTRLVKLFVDLGPDRLKLADKLIDRAAFYTIALEDLEKTINAEGCVSEYQNGENQWGTKRSPEADLQIAVCKNYLACFKQLNDMLPDDAAKPPKDALMGYIGAE